ncbi:MAG: hypothetical protein ISN28_00245 [Ectothiorhodospiraceae bacterium AqS1]|nr:hypothetical protein [Ectothiorhodospiraceae bacterium AqS1]
MPYGFSTSPIAEACAGRETCARRGAMNDGPPGERRRALEGGVGVAMIDDASCRR